MFTNAHLRLPPARTSSSGKCCLTARRRCCTGGPRRLSAQGLARLGLRREAIPDIGELSATVRAETGWQLAPVGRPFEPAAFFALLAERRFPIVTRIRPMHAFDFSPEPDLFHDLFGHVPMLLDEGLANFLHELGQAYVAQPAGSPAREQLWALYFFTAEFGLVQHEGQPRLYGAGLLSSAGEIHHCVNELTPAPGLRPGHRAAHARNRHPLPEPVLHAARLGAAHRLRRRAGRHAGRRLR